MFKQTNLIMKCLITSMGIVSIICFFLSSNPAIKTISFIFTTLIIVTRLWNIPDLKIDANAYHSRLNKDYQDRVQALQDQLQTYYQKQGQADSVFEMDAIEFYTKQIKKLETQLAHLKSIPADQYQNSNNNFRTTLFLMILTQLGIISAIIYAYFQHIFIYGIFIGVITGMIALICAAVSEYALHHYYVIQIAIITLLCSYLMLSTSIVLICFFH